MDKQDPRDPQNWIPRELFEAYVGSQSHSLLAFYDKARDKKNPLLWSFDPLAVFLPPAWFGLRRQWAMWATFTGLIGVVPFIEYGLGITLPNAAFVGTMFAMGMMARGLLLTSANALYLKLKGQGLSGAALKDALKDRAALNAPFAVAALVGSVMIVFGLAHLASILSGKPFP